MTEPMPMMSRSDAAALMPEATSMAMAAQAGEHRRRAATRAHVTGDGKVMVGGRTHVGTVSKTSGMAWRARDRKGQQVGLHASKAEAAGALVLRHEAC